MITPDSQIARAESASKIKAVVRELYLDLTGDLNTAILLGQIVYWHKPSKHGLAKMTITRGAREWLVKKKADWEHECFLSYKQYLRAEKILREKGIIEVAVFLFNGTPTTHIWLNEERLAFLIDKLPKGTFQKLPKGTFQKLPKGTFHIIEETTLETTKEITSVAKKSAKKIQSQLAENQLSIPENIEVKNKGGSSLVGWYKKLLKLNFEVGYQGVATQQEKGYLNTFVLKVGHKNAFPVMRYAIEHWMEFAYQVKLTAGANCPTQPTLPMLVKFSHIAQNLWENAAPKAKKVETKGSIVLSKDELLKY